MQRINFSFSFENKEYKGFYILGDKQYLVFFDDEELAKILGKPLIFWEDETENYQYTINPDVWVSQKKEIYEIILKSIKNS